MMDAKEISLLEKAINKKFPARKIKGVFIYKGDYLVSAPNIGANVDSMMDCFFTVDKDFNVESFSPLKDIVGFQKAITTKKLYG